jgi:hypothetical protein
VTLNSKVTISSGPLTMSTVEIVKAPTFTAVKPTNPPKPASPPKK